jgi:hypothetical protein
LTCEEGLKDRSRWRKTSPRVTHVDAVGKILYLRRHYHLGPAKISMYVTQRLDRRPKAATGCVCQRGGVEMGMGRTCG